MKKCICVGLVILLLLLAGCGAQDEWEAAEKAAGLVSDVTEDSQLRADTEKLLDAMIANDYAAAWDAVYEGADAAEFRKMYIELQPHLLQIEDYELVVSNINKTVRNGVSTVSVRYMMTAGDLRLFVDAARVEGYEGLTGFYLNEYVPVVTTGTLGSMQDANALQWIVLVMGMLGIAFTVWMFADCCCHKLRRKWLWLLFIALGYLLIHLIATPEQFRVNFNAGVYLSYTSLICYSTGGFTLRVTIPVGAVVYLICRKKLFAKYAQIQQQKGMEDQPVAAAEEMPQTLEVETEIPEPEKTEG